MNTDPRKFCGGIPFDAHVIETPAASPEEADVKRMNMLPDVAAWMGGIVVPLKLPLSAPFADVPS